MDSAQAVWGQLRTGTVLLVFQDETGTIWREIGVTRDEFLFRQMERGRNGGDVRITQPDDSRNAATGSAAEAAETGFERFFLNVCLHGKKRITTAPKSQSAIMLLRWAVAYSRKQSITTLDPRLDNLKTTEYTEKSFFSVPLGLKNDCREMDSCQFR